MSATFKCGKQVETRSYTDYARWHDRLPGFKGPRLTYALWAQGWAQDPQIPYTRPALPADFPYAEFARA